MVQQQFNVLMLVQNRSLANEIRTLIKECFYPINIIQVEQPEAFESIIGENVDIIIDYLNTDINGGEVQLDKIRRRCGDVPCILLAELKDEEKAIDLMMNYECSDLVLRDRLYRLPFSITREIRTILKARTYKNRFDRLIDQSVTEVYIFDDSEYRFIYVNDAAKKNMGFSLQELQDMTPIDIKPNISRNDFDILVEPLRSGKESKIIFETEHLRKDGSRYTVEVHLKMDEYENRPVFLALILDITQRVNIMRDNTVLLQEVHHRVKNNLAIISGFVDLELFKSSNEELKVQLIKTRNRIFSIAKVHELMYQTENFYSVNINNYIQKLVGGISSTINPDNKIQIDIQVDNIELSMNEAIPIGLLLNELCTNSIKFAMDRKKSKGKINIQLHKKSNEIYMLYSDNGKGIDPTPSIDNATSLGFQIIHSLILQIDARFRLDTTGKFKLELNYVPGQKKGHKLRSINT